MSYKEMTETFQCPGCVCGSNPDCGDYKPDQHWHSCLGHVCGTGIFPPGGLKVIALGMPKGFDTTGFGGPPDYEPLNHIQLRFWSSPEEVECPWDHLNIPVWALERDGYLFVRTYLPRINSAFIDIVCKGTLALVPNALNVEDFEDEID